MVDFGLGFMVVIGEWVSGFWFLVFNGGWVRFVVVVTVGVSMCGGGQKQWVWAVAMNLWVAEKMR